jgi:hypothetical protein
LDLPGGIILGKTLKATTLNTAIDYQCLVFMRGYGISLPIGDEKKEWMFSKNLNRLIGGWG